MLPPSRLSDTLASGWTCEHEVRNLSISLFEPEPEPEPEPGACVMTNESTLTKHKGNLAWKEIVARYQKPSVGRGVWQVVNTLVPYAALWYLMYLSLSVSWSLVVPLAILAAGFMVRVFIIHHDCGHGSFFNSSKAK